MVRVANVAIVVLQLFFVLMNVTVERAYCQTPLKHGDTRFLMPETMDFSVKYNPLFLLRHDWMRLATCISAYVYCPCYLLTCVAALSDSWAYFKVPLLLFLGAKLNALLFYHTMEFTSSSPPPNVLLYFAPEAPYLVSIALVFMQIIGSSSPPPVTTTTRSLKVD